MNCAAVRDRLTERALGAMPADDGQALDRHLAWCAACRKEAARARSRGRDVRVRARSGGARARSGRPGRGRRAGDRGQAATRRRSARHGWRSRWRSPACWRCRGLGWGAVMAGRAARFEDLSKAEQQKRLRCERRVPPDPQQLGVQRPRERGVPGNARERHARWDAPRIRPDAGVAEHDGYRDRDGERVRCHRREGLRSRSASSSRTSTGRSWPSERSRRSTRAAARSCRRRSSWISRGIRASTWCDRTATSSCTGACRGAPPSRRRRPDVARHRRILAPMRFGLALPAIRILAPGRRGRVRHDGHMGSARRGDGLRLGVAVRPLLLHVLALRRRSGPDPGDRADDGARGARGDHIDGFGSGRWSSARRSVTRRSR